MALKRPDRSACHKGHRQRMRKRIEHDPALSGFAEHEVLEVMLYCCYRRENTNDIAHALIDHFGSIAGVMLATEEELKGCGILGERVAKRFSVICAGVSEYILECLEDAEKAARIEPPQPIVFDEGTAVTPKES